MARPTTYSVELTSVICERLVLGESLRSICRDEAMPGLSTVFLWLSKHDKFVEQYARAREAQADTLADEILEISDDARNDWMERHGEEDAGWVANGEHIQRSRLRVDSRKWIASKLKPKRYGERLQVDSKVSSTADGLSDAELAHIASRGSKRTSKTPGSQEEPDSVH